MYVAAWKRPRVSVPASCPATSAAGWIGVSCSRLKKPPWLSSARFWPVPITAKTPAWMKAKERAKVTYELVGKPGSEVADFRPTELIASRISGKVVAGITAAGWRTVRLIERRASSGACVQIDGGSRPGRRGGSDAPGPLQRADPPTPHHV